MFTYSYNVHFTYLIIVYVEILKNIGLLNQQLILEA